MDQSTVIGYVNPGQVNSLFMQSVVDTIIADDRRGKHDRIIRHGGVIHTVSGPRIASARNEVVSTFLKGTTSQWLLMVDADMVWHPSDFDALISSADPEERPIVGGLCFGGGRSGIIFPTMYILRQPTDEEPNPVQIIEDYPDNTLCKVDATGAAFLLMHRSALEKIGEAFDGPSPWFVEGTVYKGMSFGEDWAFCMRAKSIDIPVYVHTGVKIGHVKPNIIDETSWEAYKRVKADIGEEGIKQAFRARIGAEPGDIDIREKATPVKAPNYVVIPQKNHSDLTIDLLRQLHNQGDAEKVIVFDNGSDEEEIAATAKACHEYRAKLILSAGQNIHEMWNNGTLLALKDCEGPANIAILNNDLRIGPHFLPRLATALRADDELVAVCPNYDKRKGSGVQYVHGTYGGKGLAGFAFMFKGELFRDGAPFDEQFEWWWGDTDFAYRIERAGKKLGFVYGVSVEHLDGGSQSTTQDARFLTAIARDRAKFLEKHNLVQNEKGQLVEAHA